MRGTLRAERPGVMDARRALGHRSNCSCICGAYVLVATTNTQGIDGRPKVEVA